jgi:hypothetical protein
MPNNVVIGCEPPLASEIQDALEELGKKEYTAHAHFHDSDALSIAFTFGESEQRLEFKNGEWRKEGVITKAIIDHLNI